jgi:hypothetical protein
MNARAFPVQHFVHRWTCRREDLLALGLGGPHPASVARISEELVNGEVLTSSESQPRNGAASPPDIRSALERIRNSHTVGASKRLIQLLDFVVEAALKGEEHDLKETMIGVCVYGRAPNYDPKADTVVRNQAWRLRAKLRDYYASEGSNDPVLIDIPKGHYAPVFLLRDTPAKDPGLAQQGNPRFPHN